MKSRLQNFITAEILGGAAASEVQTDDDLLTTEIVDSMGVMRLVAWIEDECGVQIPAADVTIENFRTIDAICDYLSRRNGSGENNHPT